MAREIKLTSRSGNIIRERHYGSGIVVMSDGDGKSYTQCDFFFRKSDKSGNYVLGIGNNSIVLTEEQVKEIGYYAKIEAPAFFLPLQEKIATDKQDKKNSKLFNTIDKVMKFQELAKQGIIHPLTCGNDSSHKHLIATVKDGKVILMCPDCDYTQNYIPDCVLDTDLNNLDWRKENG